MTSVELGAEPAHVRTDREARIASTLEIFRLTMPRITGSAALPYALACVAAAGVATVAAHDAGPVVWLAVAVVVATLALELATAEAYERNRSLRPVKRLLTAAGTGLLTGATFGWLTPAEIRGAGSIVLAASTVVAGGVLLGRLDRGRRSVLVVGGRVGAAQLITQWSSSTEVEVRGVCVPEFVDESAQRIGTVPILGSVDDVAEVAVDLGVDEVVVAPGPLLSAYDVRRLSWALESSPIELSVAAEVDGVLPRRITPRVVGHRLMLSLRPGRRSTPARWAKEALDRVAAAILLVLLSPLLLVVTFMIRHDSSGPVFFTQTRVGRDGKPFRIHKFRTMVVDAEARLAELKSADEGAGPLFKMARDPRVTMVGQHLRSTSLDELPQLFNVLKGDMSLVGPRPGLPCEAEAYDPWIRRRLRAKPGMTGAWQVGGRSRLSWSDSVRLDIDYVDNSTMREDLRIAVRTARVVAGRDGAA